MAEIEGIIFGYIAISIVLSMIALTMLTNNRNNSSYLIWHLASWIYLIKWFPLLNIGSSTVLASFAKGFNSVFSPFSLTTYTNTFSIHSEFKAIGIDSPYFLNNSGVIIIIWGFTLIVYLVALILRCSKYEKMRKAICENLIIRSTLVFFSEFNFFSMVQIMEFEVSTWYGVTNSIVSVSIVIGLLITLFFLTFSIHYRIKENDQENLLRINTLIEEFRMGTYKTQLYYSIFMIERLVVTACIVFFIKSAKIQATIAGLTLSINFFYIILIRPFNKKVDNFIVALLSFLNMLAVLFFGLLSVDLSNNTKDILAWVGISLLIAGVIAVSFMYIFRFIQKSSEGNVQSNDENNKDDIVNQTHLESSVDIRARIDNRGDNKLDSLGSMSGILRKTNERRKSTFFSNTGQGQPTSNDRKNRYARRQSAFVENLDDDVVTEGKNKYAKRQSVLFSNTDQEQFPNPVSKPKKSNKYSDKILNTDLPNIVEIENNEENPIDSDLIEEKNERIPYYTVLFNKYMKKEGL